MPIYCYMDLMCQSADVQICGSVFAEGRENIRAMAQQNEKTTLPRHCTSYSGLTLTMSKEMPKTHYLLAVI